MSALSARSRHAPRRSLAARGQPLHTFAGIAACLATAFLIAGAYLISGEFENPVGAQPTVLIFAALLIASGMALFFCLLHPAGKSRRHAAFYHADFSLNQKTVLTARENTGMDSDHRGDPPMHARYVDTSRIQLRR